MDRRDFLGTSLALPLSGAAAGLSAEAGDAAKNEAATLRENPYIRRCRDVAIGTDIAYTSRNAEAENKKFPPRSRSRTRWEALWPPETFVTTPAARDSLAWTNWPLFTVGLLQRGFSDDDIRKILGGNMLRVARDVLK